MSMPFAESPALDTLHSAAKQRQQSAWVSGDYSVIGTTLQIVGEDLCEALDLRAGSTVLDVAAGNGNGSLAAARRWCDVTCSDYVASLLDAARARAQAERLPMQFRIADAEELPFPDASFDVVMSIFGVMFTPRQEQAANELARVCRPGGRIGLASWTPDGFIGQVFKTIGQFVPAPTGLNSPALWGIRERLEELFDARSWKIRTECRTFKFRYRSAQHWMDVFRSYYGPVLKVYEVLSPSDQAELTRSLMALLEIHNRSGDGTLIVPSTYLEAVMERT